MATRDRRTNTRETKPHKQSDEGVPTVNAYRERYQPVLLNSDANPSVIFIANIEISMRLEPIPNLLICMDVLLKEWFLFFPRSWAAYQAICK